MTNRDTQHGRGPDADTPDDMDPNGAFDARIGGNSDAGNSSTENLVALALGQLAGGEAETVRSAIETDAALASEFGAIRSHLDLHAHVREILPVPTGFARLRARLAAESADADATPGGRSFLRRYWMSVAAAALLLVAVFLPHAGPTASNTAIPELDAIAGRAVRDAAGTWTSDGVCRIAYGDGVTVTMDVDTVVVPVQPQRLALRAGRIFVDVTPGRSGFAVDVGDARIVTLGTSFLVELRRTGEREFEGRVAVERGRVAFRPNRTDALDRSALDPAPRDATPSHAGGSEVAAGSELRWNDPAHSGATPAARPLPTGARLRWFEIPSLSAKILNDRTVVVVIRNEMLDPIQLAPPTGGEPLFYATVGNHSYPHEPVNFGRNVVLAPGTDFTFEMKLPQALEPGQTVMIRCPTLGLESIAQTETGR